MNRRAFLAWLGGTAAGVAAAPLLDVDRLLWVPGERTIFLPSPVEEVPADWLAREFIEYLRPQTIVFRMDRMITWPEYRWGTQ